MPIHTDRLSVFIASLLQQSFEGPALCTQPFEVYLLVKYYQQSRDRRSTIYFWSIYTTTT